MTEIYQEETTTRALQEPLISGVEYYVLKQLEERWRWVTRNESGEVRVFVDEPVSTFKEVAGEKQWV